MLKSGRAVRVNVDIMRAFVKLRRMLVGSPSRSFCCGAATRRADRSPFVQGKLTRSECHRSWEVC